MNRNQTFTNEQLSAKDTCNTNIYAMVGIAQLAEAVLGEGPFLNNLQCTEATVPDLTVYLEPGEIYSMQNIDDTAFGPIAADTTHQILKTGVLLDQEIIPLTAPATPGDSIIYLIQVEFSEIDDQSESRPYYGGSPAATLTRRADLLDYNVKASAPSPTPTPPTPDAGFVGAWLVTVDNGQTAILNSDIVAYPNAPFIDEKLSDKISQATAETLFPLKSQIQSGALTYASTTGTNTYAATLTPALAGYTDGMEVRIKFINANSTAATLNLNTLGAVSILQNDGSALIAGEITANSYRTLIYRSSSAAFLLQLASDDFVQSKATAGYIRLPGGLIYQWGSGTYSPGQTNVTLPIPFPTAFIHTSACFGSLVGGGVSCGAQPASGGAALTDIEIGLAGTGGTEGIYWAALGY